MCQRDHTNQIKPTLSKWSLEVVYYFVCKVMAHPRFPNTQMVVKVNPILKTWWKDIQKNRELEANELLGSLTALNPSAHMNITYGF